MENKLTDSKILESVNKIKDGIFSQEWHDKVTKMFEEVMEFERAFEFVRKYGSINGPITEDTHE